MAIDCVDRIGSGGSFFGRNPGHLESANSTLATGGGQPGASDTADRLTEKQPPPPPIYNRWSMNATALAALLLVSIGTLRIVSTYRVFNHVIDEPDQLAAGVEFLSTGKYLYEDEHPPLARVFGALGPFLAGERWHKGPDSYLEGYRILGFGPHYDRILTLGRAGILPFFWIASLVVYRWGLRTAGPVAALIGTLLFTTTPPILAHSGVITTDMALACWTGAAALAALYWADLPDRKRSMVFGAALALACLSKFTAPGLSAGGVAGHGPRGLTAPAGLSPIPVPSPSCWLPPSWSSGPPTPFLLPAESGSPPARRAVLLRHPLRWTHNRLGHRLTCWAGAARTASGTTTGGSGGQDPAGNAAFAPAGALLVDRKALSRKAAIPAAFCAAVLLCAMCGRVNIGVRLILPIYVGFAVVGGCVAAAAKGRLARAMVAALLAWVVISGALQHPDYLAYFNEIAGSRPERFLVGFRSRLGPGHERLGDFLAQAGVTQVAFSPFNRTYALAGHPFPAMTPSDPDHPSPGWNAVSITTWKVFGFPAWAGRIPPQMWIGRSILLWYFPGKPE